MSETSSTAHAPDADERFARKLSLLVLRCQTGDPDAFAGLYEQFSNRTLRYLRGIVGDAAADDVQQEVWLTVYRRIAEVANPAGFRTWLYRVTRHRAIDTMRRARRGPDLAGSGDDLDQLQVASGERAESAPDAAFDQPTLAPLLARLSDPHREVLLLRFWDDLSYAEIALVVGCSIGTVRSRLHHAKLHVARLLEAAPEPERAGRQS